MYSISLFTEKAELLTNILLEGARVNFMLTKRYYLNNILKGNGLALH